MDSFSDRLLSDCSVGLLGTTPGAGNNADRSTLLGVLDETRALLNQPDERPFAAALALARRTELRESEVLDLIEQPNASRRTARGVRCALDERAPR